MTGPGPRVAAVTGGAGAIGASIAEALAAAGHRVIILDRARDPPVDLADERQVRAAAQRVLDQAGRCDVLVHAAAAFDRADLARLDLAVWRPVQAVNVESALLLAQAFVPGMAARGFGRIIFVVSDTVWAPPAADLLPYVTSKGALVALARALAVAHGPDGIAVTCVAPGLTDTPAARAGMPAAAFETVRARQALPRALRPGDVAATVAFLASAALAMMADNIEHVITYWVLWQKFHSPALAGFEVISHWVPFLLFSVYFGSLADRYDCRRLIQAAQALFMLVSALWGVLFLTNSLQVWEACVLLVLHGCAGALWGPGEQLMLHDFVGREELPSAVRLNATFRSLGILFGPVVGSALLLGLGPTRGIFANIAFYLPLTLFLFRTKFTGHVRDHGIRPPRIGMLGSLRVLRDVRSNHVLVSMIVLGGLGSFFVGTSLQTAMPLFAHDLGAGSAGTAYGVLLFANGAGGVIGGVLLEVTGRIRPTVKAAVVSTAVYGATTLFFALTSSYLLALAMLLIGGIANLASMSIGQTIVQLLAPPADRGRVIGLYGVSANGLRAGSGFTVGILGAAISIHWSLGLSAVALCLGTLAAGIYALRGRAADADAPGPHGGQ